MSTASECAPDALSHQHRLILEALLNCNGKATAMQLALKTGYKAGVISRSLSKLPDFVDTGMPIDGKPAWFLIRLRLPPLPLALWNKLDRRRQSLIKLKRSRELTAAEATELQDLEFTAQRRSNKRLRGRAFLAEKFSRL